MRRLSISLRLVLWYSSISLMGFLAFGVMMRFVLSHSMIEWKDRTLQMRANHVESALRSVDRDDRTRLALRLSETVGALPEGELIQVKEADGRLLFPAAAVRPEHLLDHPPCATLSVEDRFVGSVRLRQLCKPVSYAGRLVFVIAPSSLAEDRILLRDFTLGLFRTIPLILLISGVSGYVLSRRALQPIDQLISEARAITPDDLTKRLSISTPDDQLRRLAVEWNNLLSRIHLAMLQVTQFTADASHELRSPVAYIRATAEYALGFPALDEESRNAFNEIVEETGRVGNLLTSLLALARLDLPKINRTASFTEVQDLLAELSVYFESSLKSRNQQLLVSDTNGIASIDIEALHLRQILIAIIENAIKYTPHGGTIHVRHGPVGMTWEFNITDTGIGIAAEHLPRIFDRFYRVDQVRGGAVEGFGLGLSIAKLAVEWCAGSIDVTSTPGLGTTFTVRLPLARTVGS